LDDMISPFKKKGVQEGILAFPKRRDGSLARSDCQFSW